MIQLILALLTAELGLLLFIIIKCPLWKHVILALDQIKRGRGPLVIKTFVATISVVLASNLHSMHKIQERSLETRLLNPTDQVLFTKHLLEVSFIGYTLFLWLIIDRVHHYINEIRGLKKSMKDEIKLKRILEDERLMEGKKDSEIRELNVRIVQLELDIDMKDFQVKSVKASAVALGKQMEGFLLEYDRLLDENQILRNELKLMDRRFSHCHSKKFS